MFAELNSLLPKYAKWSTLSRDVSSMIMFGSVVMDNGCAGWCRMFIFVTLTDSLKSS